MKSQREATVNAILSVLKDRGINYELGGTTKVIDVLEADDKKKVQTILATGFNKGEIELSADAQKKYVGNTSEMNKYVSGLINNWVRKYSDFNGGEKYVPKNPGSRQGTSDEQVKEMRKLLKVTTDASAKEAIEAAISARITEIKPASKIEVNMDVIPAELKAKLGLE